MQNTKSCQKIDQKIFQSIEGICKKIYGKGLSGRPMKGASIIFILLLFISNTACQKNQIVKDYKRVVDFSLEPTSKKNVYLDEENVGNKKESEIRTIVETRAKALEKGFEDAKLDEETWTIDKKEVIGRRVNVDKTLANVLNSREDSRLTMIVEEVRPAITADDLKASIKVIGSFRTPILDGRDSRINNIELASDKIDCYKIGPGEEFSFNGVLGKRTVKKGYEKAPVIIKKEDGFKKGYGVGGGICQLSSTIYNAAKRSGMEITERHMHSKKVGYVPKGQDAAVSYGTADFRFINNRKNVVMIRVFLSSSDVTVKILENKSLHSSGS